jgi:ParB-like chromosome segregation protein Spo0J
VSKLQVTYRLAESISINPRNARTHSPKQIAQIARSIERFGFDNPILIGDDGQVIAGHGRLAAARLLGIESVPTILLEHLTPDQRRAYVVADNRLAELAGWDKEILSIELQGLLSIELDFEITDIGFEMAEIDLLLEYEGSEAEDTEAEPDFAPEDIPVVAHRGDLWQLGEHLLFCGDARS